MIHPFTSIEATVTAGQSRKSIRTAIFRRFRPLASTMLACLMVKETARAAEIGPLPKQPRIVNIYNFIRNSDYRLQNSACSAAT